jgi:hypothetical protein
MYLPPIYQLGLELSQPQGRLTAPKEQTNLFKPKPRNVMYIEDWPHTVKVGDVIKVT